MSILEFINKQFNEISAKEKSIICEYSKLVIRGTPSAFNQECPDINTHLGTRCFGLIKRTRKTHKATLYVDSERKKLYLKPITENGEKLQEICVEIIIDMDCFSNTIQSYIVNTICGYNELFWKILNGEYK